MLDETEKSEKWESICVEGKNYEFIVESHHYEEKKVGRVGSYFLCTSHSFRIYRIGFIYKFLTFITQVIH